MKRSAKKKFDRRAGSVQEWTVVHNKDLQKARPYLEIWIWQGSGISTFIHWIVSNNVIRLRFAALIQEEEYDAFSQIFSVKKDMTIGCKELYGLSLTSVVG